MENREQRTGTEQEIWGRDKRGWNGEMQIKNSMFFFPSTNSQHFSMLLRMRKTADSDWESRI
jgi:hypothetical protein